MKSKGLKHIKINDRGHFNATDKEDIVLGTYEWCVFKNDHNGMNIEVYEKRIEALLNK
jgi:hypothetical protein